MIIETSDSRFYKVREIEDNNLFHLWTGIAVKRVKGEWLPKANSRPELVRKMASRVVEA